MPKQSNNNGGCGLVVICLLIVFAIGKCSGGSTPTAQQNDLPEITGTSSVATTTMYVTTATLNCRATPDASARIMEKLNRGDAVSVGETGGTWVKLDRPGEDCWVAQRFLSENEPERDPAPQPVRLYSSPRGSLETLSSPRGGPSCGTKWKCGQMDSCAEAYHYLNECGLGRLDGDGDGVPCESIC